MTEWQIGLLGAALGIIIYYLNLIHVSIKALHNSTHYQINKLLDEIKELSKKTDR